MDAIHALLIISLWTSVLPSGDFVGRHSDVPDGWHLLSTAVHMAQKLRLDLAAGEVNRLLVENKRDQPEYELALEQCRVVGPSPLYYVLILKRDDSVVYSCDI